jgi:hypothetical protein
MNRACIYTAICGGYDDLKPQPEQTIPCDFVCFTDEPARFAGAGWRTVPLEWGAADGHPPWLRAKFPKVMPHAAFEEARGVLGEPGGLRYDYTIWVDASVRILRPELAERMIAAAGDTGMALVRHPERDCVYGEVEASFGPWTAHKHAGAPLREQAAHYRAEGYPERNGLYSGGVVARDMGSERVRAVDEAWWAEILRWSTKDQVSLPYALWRLGARVGAVELDLWRNPLFEVWPRLDPADGGLSPRSRPEYSAAPFRRHPHGDSPGVFDPALGMWHLDQHDPTRRQAFSFGPPASAMLPFMGDWRGAGASLPGLYDPAIATFFLRHARSPGPADVTFPFGRPGGIPVCGDWDGDGRDGVGVFFPDTGSWALTNRLGPGPADVEFSFGPPDSGMLPVAGDWDGRGRDRVGLYAPGRSNWFLLMTLETGGRVDTFGFGPERGAPLTGDWNGDGADEVGVYVPEQGQAFLANANRAGSACRRALVDPPGGMAIARRERRKPRARP